MWKNNQTQFWKILNQFIDQPSFFIARKSHLIILLESSLQVIYSLFRSCSAKSFLLHLLDGEDHIY